MSVANRGTREHYRWGSDCDGWRLLDRADLSVIEESMPPGTAEVRHRHRRARQFFRVLAGQLEVEVEGQITTLGPGDGLEVPPGLAHEVRNTADSDAHFLVISSPTTSGDREPVPQAP